MKKLISTLITVFLVQGAFAQIMIPDPGAGTGAYHSWSVYYGWVSDAWGRTYWGHEQGMEGSSWLRDPSHSEHQTIAGGNSSYSRNLARSSDTNGDGIINASDALDVQNLTLYLNHNLTGRYRSVFNTAFDMSSASTTIIAKDGAGEASLTGVANDSTHPNTSGAPDNAVVVLRWNGNTKEGDYTFKGGSYFGGDGYGGAFMANLGSITIEGASFIGGTTAGAARSAVNSYTIVRNGGAVYSDINPNVNQGMYGGGDGLESGASGAYFLNAGAVSISNRTGDATDRFEATTMDSSSNVTGGGTDGAIIMVLGGDGLALDGGNATVKIMGGDFYGSRDPNGSEATHSVDYTNFDTKNATVTTRGGRGVSLVGKGKTTITAGNYYGGNGGEITVGGAGAHANSMGGEGLMINGSSSNPDLSGGTYIAGKSQDSTIIPTGTYQVGSGDPVKLPASDANGTAIALGASGIRLFSAGTATISGVTATGSRGATATANGTGSSATASGGNGLLAQTTTTTINSGTFTGADGGNANSTLGSANAYGGAGVLAIDGTLNINGGTFTGGKGGRVNGQREIGNIGVWTQNAVLNITGANTLINGDLVINNSAAKAVNILGGTISGDILSVGTALTTLKVSTNATYGGAFKQSAGTVTVTLANSSESKFFSDVQMSGNTTAMNLNGVKVITAENASFVLGQNISETGSILTFGTGLELSKGSSINAGYGQVKVTANDLVMRDNSSLAFGFDSLSGVGGSITIGGNLVASNANNKIIVSGVSATQSGTKKIVTSAGVNLGGNTLQDVLDVDFGWLTTTDWATSTAGAGGITAAYKYNSLTNGSLMDLNYTLLTNVDAIVSGLSPNEFYALNSGGNENGTKMFRYSLSQMPDVADAAFQEQRQASQQIVARNTEFRSMNGYASSQPNFNKKATPAGAAGPATDEEKSMQGWIRGYGAHGNQNSDGTSSSYDNNSWGTLVGVDKSFGNLLIGLAGGYGHTRLDASSAYTADVSTSQGSIYSTIGGEDTFIDMALTYGESNTKENNSATTGKFDTSIYSGYLGAGKTFQFMEKLAITPEASMLASYYDQDSYERTGIVDMNIAGYDQWSYLGSIGANFATVHQIDWMNRGMAILPEVRAHWLHEFNADIDNGNFTTGGVNGSQTLFVRSRNEDYLNLGLGLNIWNWKYQNAKFEIDYDGLFSSDYTQHTVSGKITVRF